MSHRLFPIRTTFSNEFSIIGRLLLEYGELELSLLNAVHMGRDDDFNTTFKALYRTRGEKQRIEIADGLGRQAYINLRLEAEFANAISWLHHCRKIRNQYAHAVWHEDGAGRLCFVGLEDLARQNAEVPNLIALKFFYLDAPLLEEQGLFFRYTGAALSYLNYEGRVRAGKSSSHLFPKIQGLTLPKFHRP